MILALDESVTPKERKPVRYGDEELRITVVGKQPGLMLFGVAATGPNGEAFERFFDIPFVVPASKETARGGELPRTLGVPELCVQHISTTNRVSGMIESATKYVRGDEEILWDTLAWRRKSATNRTQCILYHGRSIAQIETPIAGPYARTVASHMSTEVREVDVLGRGQADVILLLGPDSKVIEAFLLQADGFVTPVPSDLLFQGRHRKSCAQLIRHLEQWLREQHRF